MQSLKKNEKHFLFIKMKYRIEGIKKKVIKERSWKIEFVDNKKVGYNFTLHPIR